MQETFISKLGDIRSANSTSECVEAINAHYKQGKWKRKTKFNLHLDTPREARVFTDGKEFVTVIDIGGEVILCRNLDLGEHKEILEKVFRTSKHYYTHDYGEIWYNPWEKKLWVSGGDGGFMYDEKRTAKQLAKLMEEEGFEDGESVPYFHEKIPELKSSTFEAEHSPDPYYDGEEIDNWNKDQLNFIEVGSIVDLCNIDY